ncbi:MAG: hypothetical protein IJ387_04560, partial [Thermoguttaceae bacterium]|nr:hypothetical protein [Thermoguttaceae bacterium]
CLTKAAALVVGAFWLGNVATLTADETKTDASGKTFVEKRDDETAKIVGLADFLRDENFPYRFLKAEARLDRSDVRVEKETGTASVAVRLLVDVDAYYDFAEKLDAEAKKLALKTRLWGQNFDSETQKGSWFVDHRNAPKFDADYAYLLLPTKRPKNFKKVSWRVYSVPLKTAILLRRYAAIAPSVELICKDAAGEIVARRCVSSYWRHGGGYNSPAFSANLCYEICRPYGKACVMEFSGNALRDGESNFFVVENYTGKIQCFYFLPVFQFIPARFPSDGGLKNPNYLRKTVEFSKKLEFSVDELERIEKIECRVVEKNSKMDAFYERLEKELAGTPERVDFND